jgi:hypothetical protein
VRRLACSFLPLVGGVTGVVLAHAGAYLLAFPSADRRADALQTSGHGYWDHAVVLAVVAGVLIVAQAAVRGLRRSQAEAGAESGGFGRRLVLLAGWQVALFTGMEVIERIVAGVAPGTLLDTPSFALGVLLQLAVAATLLLLLGGFENLVAEVARRVRYTPAAGRRPPLWRLPEFAFSSRRFSPAPPRAPPSPASG